MSYYRTCPHCGAHLDPGEACTDCQDKIAALGAANTESGGVDKTVEKAVESTSIISENQEENQV